MKYIVRNMDETPTQEIICGTLRELTNQEDCKKINVTHVTITGETKKHYHKIMKEAYYVLKGVLQMELDDEIIDCPKGTLIMMAPGVKHKARQVSEEKPEVLVIATPAWSADDEFVVEE